jgi:cytidylate kinase
MAVITISRQYGSGGDEIASQLSRMLGYRYFDKKMMAQAAVELGFSSKEVIDAQEDQHQVLSFFDRLFGHKVTEAWESKDEVSGARVVEIGEQDSKKYVTLSHKLIKMAYEQDNVVILGRGGQAVLHGLPGVLHIRIEAPIDDRVRRISEQQRFTNPVSAREFIESRDRAAADYLRTYHKVDWTDPTLYHLTINTGMWSIDTAACVIADILKYMR